MGTILLGDGIGVVVYLSFPEVIDSIESWWKSTEAKSPALMLRAGLGLL